MNLLRNTILGFCTVFLFTAQASAAPEEYAFDKAHTQILFFVNHLGFSNSQGEFLEYDGRIMIDQEDMTKSSVEVAVLTDSIDMDDEKWDEHLKGSDFFDVEQHPEMTFKSTGIIKTGDNTGELVGDLTLLGVTRPISLDATFNKCGAHPMNGDEVCGFSLTGTLNRSEFGMNYGVPGVSDEVELRIEVEAVKVAADAENVDESSEVYDVESMEESGTTEEAGETAETADE